MDDKGLPRAIAQAQDKTMLGVALGMHPRPLYYGFSEWESPRRGVSAGGRTRRLLQSSFRVWTSILIAVEPRLHRTKMGGQVQPFACVLLMEQVEWTPSGA